MSTISERVARGAAWLDDVRPGWRDQVSLTTLTLANSRLCILGQVFGQDDERGGFWVGTEHLYNAFRGAPEGGIDVLGFNPYISESDAKINAERFLLEAEWRRVIHAPQPARVIA